MHRGDNSWADEFAPNQAIYTYALEYYLHAGFTYLEVGDGDELMKNRDVGCLRKAHASVYQILQKFYARGRLYYLFGNHDLQYRDRNFALRALDARDLPYQIGREPLFPGIEVHEGLVLVHQESGGEIFVTHGHQGEWLNTRFWKLSRFLLRRLWRPLQLLGIHNPFQVSNNPDIQQKIELEFRQWIVENDRPLLCGHTHRAHFSFSGDIPYFNTGSCIHPRWITGIEIDEGNIQLVRWRVKPGPRGELVIHREIVSGPERVGAYFSSPPDDHQSPLLVEAPSRHSSVLENAQA